MSAWGIAEAMPPGVQIIPAADSSYYVTAERAAEIDARLRRQVHTLTGQAATVIDTLHEARHGNVWQLRDWPTWHAYVLDVFHDLRNLPLGNTDQAITERRAIVRSLLEEPKPDGKRRSVTDVQKVTGWSRGTVAADRAALGYSEAANRKVIELRPDPEPPPAPTGTLYDQAAEYLARQGERGLTIRELMHEAGWEWQRASGVLSRLHHKKRRAAPSGEFRGGLSVYVATVTP